MFALPLLFSIDRTVFSLLCKLIILTSFLESSYCILQYLNILPSLDSFFHVTGSWKNPNVTAMFLAMTFPAFLIVTKQEKGHLRSPWFWTGTSFIIFSIILLKGRTALIGLLIIVILFVITNNTLRRKLKEYSLYRRILLLFFTSLLGSLFVYKLVLYKQASSEGRLFVWKISLQDIKNKALLGSGLGMFEHDYNLAQANYFANGHATSNEVENAAFVRVAYNEFLATTFQGGSIALILFCTFILFLLFVSIRVVKEHIQHHFFDIENIDLTERMFCVFGLLAFCGMSLVNFTINAVPVMVVFVVYISRVVSNEKLNTESQSSNFSKIFTSVAVPLFCVIATVLLYQEIVQAKVYNTAVTARDIAKDGNFRDAANSNKTVEKIIKGNASYWADYGYSLYKIGYYKPALARLRKAIQVSSNPDYYTAIGDCYNKLNLRDSAITSYTIAANIQPNRLTPQLGLMYLYFGNRDTSQALQIANKILLMKPKVEGERATNCKQEAQKFINTINK
jgi:tetratricopeptide (TPR) repeat protein